MPEKMLHKVQLQKDNKKSNGNIGDGDKINQKETKKRKTNDLTNLSDSNEIPIQEIISYKLYESGYHQKENIDTNEVNDQRNDDNLVNLIRQNTFEETEVKSNVAMYKKNKYSRLREKIKKAEKLLITTASENHQTQSSSHNEHKSSNTIQQQP